MMRNALLLPGAAFAALSLAPAAYADIAQSKALVDAAKVRGEVGEQADGYLGVVKGGDSAVARAVQEINAGRAGAYEEAGRAAGTSTAVAAVAAGEKLMARTPPGHYVKPAGGGWVRK